MSEIEQAINQGKEVITHTNAVTVPGYTGAGYIILDPITGDGAYKIAGGENGGYIIGLYLGLFTATMIFMGIHGKNPAILTLALGILAFLISLQIVYKDELNSGTWSVAKCLMAGFMAGFSSFGITSADIGKSVIAKLFAAIGFANYTLDPLKVRQECGM